MNRFSILKNPNNVLALFVEHGLHGPSAVGEALSISVYVPPLTKRLLDSGHLVRIQVIKVFDNLRLVFGLDDVLRFSL